MYYTHKELQFEHDNFVLYGSMTIVSIFRGGGFGDLAGWYSYFFGTIIRHTRVSRWAQWCNG